MTLTPPPVIKRTVTLALERIGDDRPSQSARIHGFGGRVSLLREIDEMRRGRPWVVEVVGLGRRVRMDARRSYERANGSGSRGVYDVYHLREGHVYEVREVTGWTSSNQYYCTVRGGELVRLSREEVKAWQW